MTTSKRGAAKRTPEQLQAEIERAEARLNELKKLLAARLEEEEIRLRKQLDRVTQAKRRVSGEAPVAVRPAAPRARGRVVRRARRRTAKQMKADAKKIYDVIAAAKGITRAEIRSRLPRTTPLPQNIKAFLARFGFKVKGSGPRPRYRYTAAK